MAIPQRREEHYKLKVLGKSGIFDMKNDIYVEYLQTSLTIDQIEEISSVRKEFKRGELSFDLMMQREVDDERIKNELIPYLIENELSFFPPITVAILETDNKAHNSSIPIKNLYPELNLEANYFDGNNYFEKRKFGNLFSIDILKDNNEKQRWYTELTVGSNATLLAVDGQHRLIAFQAILNKLSDSESEIYKDLDKSLLGKISNKDFSNLTIPVTFIFVPQLHEGNSQQLTLVEAFRKIFVDINRNARKVNEMRNVLLDEQDLRSIFTRKVCSKIQGNELVFTSISIDEIEWEKNTRENQLSNPLAITNILFLREVFSSWVGEQDNLGKTGLKDVMKLAQYSADLEISEEYSYNNLDVEHFSYLQKKFILEIFERDFTISFIKLINSLPYIIDRHYLIQKIKDGVHARREKASTADEVELSSKIKEVLFDGEEKRIHLKKKQVKDLVDELLLELTKFQRDHALDIVRTRVFQKAYFQTLFKIYNNKILSEHEKFEDFCDFINANSNAIEFNKFWNIVFVNYQDLLAKAFKGRSGYSMSTNLIESFENLLYLFFITIFNKMNLKLNELPKDQLENCKKIVIKNSIFKYTKDVEKTSSGEEETTDKTITFQKELDIFINLFNIEPVL